MDILKEIKLEVKRKIKLDKQKEILTDKMILDVIKTCQVFDDETKCFLIKMYAAIYYDNLELLEYLEKSGLSLGIFPSNLSIYLLDKSMSRYFTKESYMEFIRIFKPFFANFFLSIRNIDEKKRDYYLKRFIYLTIVNKSKLEDIQLNQYINISGIFSKNSLDTFSDEAYRHASETQLGQVMNFLKKVPSEETKKRLNGLIITSDFATYFHDYDFMFSLFSDEELKNMTPKVEYYFKKAAQLAIDLQRVLRIYHSNPNIIYNTGVLRKDIFANLSDEEIISLSQKINFSRDEKQLKSYYLKRRVLSLLPWTP